MIKNHRLKFILLSLPLLAAITLGASYVMSRPEKIYYLTISTNGRAPSTYVVTDYKPTDHWLWYKERDGGEYTINVHASQVIIHSETIQPTTNLYVIRENTLGAGSTLDSGFKGPSDGT